MSTTYEFYAGRKTAGGKIEAIGPYAYREDGYHLIPIFERSRSFINWDEFDGCKIPPDEFTDEQKERFKDTFTEEDCYLEDAIEDIISNLDDEELFRAIQDLTDDQKELLYEIAILMKRPGDIAEREGISCAAVTQRMDRIRAKLLRK